MSAFRGTDCVATRPFREEEEEEEEEKKKKKNRSGELPQVTHYEFIVPYRPE